MSTEPTLYFPENVLYEIGFRQARRWSSEVLVGPSGRRQVRKIWQRPKRSMRATIYSTVRRGAIVNAGDDFGDNDPVTGGVVLADDDMWGDPSEDFLNTVAGQYLPFWIFDPAPRSYYAVGTTVSPAEAGFRVSSAWNGNGPPLPFTVPLMLPITLPFRGNWTGLGNPVAADVRNLVFRPVGAGTPLVYSPSEFVIDNSVGGNRLTSFTPTISPDPDPGEYYLNISVKNAHEKIPVVMTSDVEETSFFFSSATPWPELSFDCEEYFG